MGEWGSGLVGIGESYNPNRPLDIFAGPAEDQFPPVPKHLPRAERARLEQERQEKIDLYNAGMQEGAGAAVDPQGALDRQRAQRELAGRFDIVGDDVPASERKPNQITQAELQEIARTYSDIRLGRTDIEFDVGGAKTMNGENKEKALEEFRNGAMDDIATIMQTPAGRALVGQLAHNEVSGPDGTIEHRKTTLFGGADPNKPETNVDRSRMEDASNGRGLDATIYYEPGHLVDVKSDQAWAHEGRGDLSLFHEMIHAYHDTHGTYDTHAVNPVEGDVEEVARRAEKGGRLQQEEYNTVGIDNTWRSDLLELGGQTITENAYRAQRRQIEVGAVAGDAEMHDRTQYGF